MVSHDNPYLYKGCCYATWRKEEVMTRRESREHLFCLLFQKDFYNQTEYSETLPAYFEGLDKAVSEDGQQEIIDKLTRLISHLEEIDMLIEKYATGWTMDRIGKAELALLRIAVFEAKYEEDIPVGVAINEAVELAKIYGEDNAPAFINGILGKIVNE